MKFAQTEENFMDMTVVVKQEEFETLMENAESKKIPVKIRSNFFQKLWNTEKAKNNAKGSFRQCVTSPQ